MGPIGVFLMGDCGVPEISSQMKFPLKLDRLLNWEPEPRRFPQLEDGTLWHFYFEDALRMPEGDVEFVEEIRLPEKSKSNCIQSRSKSGVNRDSERSKTNLDIGVFRKRIPAHTRNRFRGAIESV